MSRHVKQKGSIMDNTNKITKWSFIFCNFYAASDRAKFKAKMKRNGLATDYLNQYNLIVVGLSDERNFILNNIPDKATFQELIVTDAEFSAMKSFKGGL